MLTQLYDYVASAIEYKANQFSAAVREQKRHYEAAGHGRRTEKWHRRSAGPTSDTNQGIRTLRGFSRDLVRNNPHAQRAINVIATNVVGSGITPAFKGPRAKFMKKTWADWADSSECDFYENVNFYGLQEQVIRAVAESGGALIMRRWNYASKVGFDLQVLEDDYLDETKTMQVPGDSGSFIMQGVQFDRFGKKEGYWIYYNHPNEIGVINSQASRFVRKSEVIHVYDSLRPGLVRGVPMGVSSFIRLKDFDEYQDAQLHTQKVAACFVMTVTNTNPTPVEMRELEQDLDIGERMTPGQVMELPYGRDVKFSQPPNVSGADGYSLTVLRSIAAGYNITYESLTNDYSHVNFTSGRMGWLEFARTITSLQDRLMITKMCKGVYNWVEEGLALKTGFAPKAEVTWTTPRREMLDPLKEGAAIISLIKAGLLSRQESIRQFGYDPDDVNAEIAEDMSVADAMNALFSTDVKYRPELTKPASGNTVKPQATKAPKKAG